MLKGMSITLWGDLSCNILPLSLNNVNTQALLNITDIYNLKQLIIKPTRVTMLVALTRTMYLGLEYVLLESVIIV